MLSYLLWRQCSGGIGAFMASCTAGELLEVAFAAKGGKDQVWVKGVACQGLAQAFRPVGRGPGLGERTQLCL